MTTKQIDKLDSLQEQYWELRVAGEQLRTENEIKINRFHQMLRSYTVWSFGLVIILGTVVTIVATVMRYIIEPIQ